MKTAKSLLLEHYQKLGQPLPVFRDLPSTGPPHSPVFRCEVSLANGDRLLGDHCSSKQESQQSAAQIALNSLSTALNTPHLCPTNYQKAPLHCLDSTVCIIDYENLPQLYPLVQQTGIKTYVVIGEHHHKANQQFPGAIKVLCPSMASNGVDTCITMLVGSLLAQGWVKTYLLVSRDKFISVVAELIRTAPSETGRTSILTENGQTMPLENDLWPAREAIIITQERHLSAAIENLK